MLLKNVVFTSLLAMFAVNVSAQEEKTLPKTLRCFVLYQTKGEAGFFKGVDLVGGSSELRQNNFLGGFSADLSQFLQYSEQPRESQLFSLVGSTDNQVDAVFDVSLYYWYNSQTKDLSMVGVILRLAKDSKKRDTMNKRLERFDKNYQLSIKQEFSAQRDTMSKIEMPNPNNGSRIAYIFSECSLK